MIDENWHPLGNIGGSPCFFLVLRADGALEDFLSGRCPDQDPRRSPRVMEVIRASDLRVVAPAY